MELEQGPFPRGVTPEARAVIDGFIDQGKSPEVGIALCIITYDAKLAFDSLRKRWEEGILKGSDEERFDIFCGIAIPVSYYADGSFALLKAAGEPLPEHPAQGNLADYVLEHGDRRVALEAELTMDEIEQKRVVVQADTYLFEEIAMDVFRTLPPLEAIDRYAELASQQLALNPHEDRLGAIIHASLREGRRRFHELFEDIQRPLPEPANF